MGKIIKKLVYLFMIGLIFGTNLLLASPSRALPSKSITIPANVHVSPVLSLTVDNGPLVIDDLTSGNAVDSNPITLTVSTNTPYGYHLTASVGDSTDNTTRNLVSPQNGIFSPLSSPAATVTNFSENEWGYAYKDGASWSDYNALPLYSATPAIIKTSDTLADADTIDFKIAARASEAQPVGEYTNVINFAVTAKPKPILTKYMQDYNKTWTLAANEQVVAVDKRDNKSYHVKRIVIEDKSYDQVWMMDNLAFDGTDGNDNIITLTDQNTDIPDGSEPFNWSTTDGIGTWVFDYTTPSIVVYNDGYEDDSLAQDADYVWPYGAHYNYSAATLEGITGDSNKSAVTRTICPKGWTLPTGGSSDTADFRKLYLALGGTSTSTTGNTDFSNLVRTTLHLPFSGFYNSFGAANQGSLGYFWSSPAYTTSERYGLYVVASDVNPQNIGSRRNGFSIRCVPSN